MNAQTITLYAMLYSPEFNSALHIHLDCKDEHKWYYRTWPSQVNWKGRYKISSTCSHNVLIYCILNAELNIILLHWNKQHRESSIIKWGCCLLDENFHLVLMFTCFGSMQICIVLNFELSSLHFGKQLTCTCLRSRHRHVVEIYTCTMVFWICFPLVPPQVGDWHHHLDRCRRSESSDHRTW